MMQQIQTPEKNVGHADVLYPNYLKMVLFSNVTERQPAPHIYWKEPSNISYAILLYIEDWEQIPLRFG